MNADDRLLLKFSESKYYRIGEVSELAGVEPHVLRFWETEFTAIKPRRTPSGQRLYRAKDLELILKIKELLHEKRYTIKGAKNQLKSVTEKPLEIDILMREIRAELKYIYNLLK